MEYTTASEARKKRKMSPEQPETLCKMGHISGTVQQNEERLRPVGARQSTVRHCPFLTMTNLYSVPGSADCVAEALEGADAALFRAQLAYYRGEIEAACNASRALLENNADFDIRIGAGMLLSLGAMYRGDLQLWSEARKQMEAVPCRSMEEEEQHAFWLAAANSAIYDTRDFPAWFQRGSFEHLPADAYPFACFFYIKQLLVFCQGVAALQISDNREFSVMRVIPAVAEPMISQAQVDGALMAELYLRLLCAIGWHDCGDDALASLHLDRAIELALPDRLFSPLAEYRKQLHFLMDGRLRDVSPEALAKVRRLNKQLLGGWVKLHNTVLDRTVSNELTVREHEVARLAAFGFSNMEIAKRLHITVGSVKQTLVRVMDKTNVKSRRDLKKYV